MTPLPKRKLSRKRQGKRRAAIKLSTAATVLCPNCHKPILPHQMCKHCGFYGGKSIRPIATASLKH